MIQYGKQKLCAARIMPKGIGSRHCDPTTPTKSGRAKERHGIRREIDAQLEPGYEDHLDLDTEPDASWFDDASGDRNWEDWGDRLGTELLVVNVSSLLGSLQCAT